MIKCKKGCEGYWKQTSPCLTEDTVYGEELLSKKLQVRQGTKEVQGVTAGGSNMGVIRESSSKEVLF